MPSQIANLAALLALFTAATAQMDGLFGSDDPNCDGYSLQGYCCPGTILSSGNYGNNNDFDVSGLTCCVGDPEHGFSNVGSGDASCTAGTATPLTAVSGAAGGATASATTSAMASETAASSSEATSVETTSAGMASMTNSEGMTSMAATTSSGMTTSMSSGAAQAQASSASSTSSTAGAARAMITAAPALGGAALGLLALL